MINIFLGGQKISKSTQEESSLSISLQNVSYNKDSKILTIGIKDLTFVGYYKNYTKLSILKKDIFDFMKERDINLEKIFFLDNLGNKISEKMKLKNLDALKKEELKTKRTKAKSKKIKPYPLKIRRQTKEESEILEDSSMEYLEVDEVSPKERKGEPKTPRSIMEEEFKEAEVSSSFTPRPTFLEKRIENKEEEDELEVYNINMVLQYYSIMMERRSYLLYVYFSHEELKIIDEEGKIIFRTTIKIETLKKEPPILNLKIEGKGFEVHPLNGRVIVKKDAINPPVMIFSIMPLKLEKVKRIKKKEIVRRFLHVYIDYEDETINHTVLAIIVQPKHYRLKLGLISLNINKGTAYAISLISLIIGIGSLLYTIFSFGSSPGLTEFLGGFIPGFASIIFFITYIIGIIKGFYPLKQKWLNLMNFDKFTSINK